MMYNSNGFFPSTKIDFNSFNNYASEYKVQKCDVTKEPFQVTYDEECGRACFQPCGSTPGGLLPV